MSNGSGNGRQAGGRLQGQPEARGQWKNTMTAFVQQLLMAVEADGPVEGPSVTKALPISKARG